MSASTKTNETDPLLHPAQVAKLLGVSLSWLAKSRLTGTGPRFIKIGRAVRYAMSAVREYILSRQRNSKVLGIRSVRTGFGQSGEWW
jgi:predicted DNA-binding transcriptional regulator AlpA